jgi:glycosyltransferase involved in cell wall biosynthesis
MTTASADVPLKGLVPLLEALAKVRTERHAELVVVGQPRGGSLVPATIERLGLGGAVTIAGVVDNLRMVELYAEAEVAVVPSLYEGFSLPAVEAMACGLPLVTTTGGALPEVVGAARGRSECALLVPPNDPGALAAALVRALDDAEGRARMGAAGRARVLDRFTWRATAEATVDVYRQVLARTGGPAANW